MGKEGGFMMLDVAEKIMVSILNILAKVEEKDYPLEALPILVDCLIKLLKEAGCFRLKEKEGS